jgi:phage gp45-like
MGIDRDTLRAIQTLIRPLAMRLANSIVRGVVRLTDDGKKQQKLQVDGFPGGPADGAEHFHPYGFSSVPLGGAEAVVLFPNGDGSHPLIIAVSDRRYRPTGGEPGEVTVYNHTGAKAVFTKDGDIVLTPAPGRKVKLGSDAASDPPALSSELEALKVAIVDDWIPVANDGGASLKAVFDAWTVPGATKVDVE